MRNRRKYFRTKHSSEQKKMEKAVRSVIDGVTPYIERTTRERLKVGRPREVQKDWGGKYVAYEVPVKVTGPARLYNRYDRDGTVFEKGDTLTLEVSIVPSPREDDDTYVGAIGFKDKTSYSKESRGEPTPRRTAEDLIKEWTALDTLLKKPENMRDPSKAEDFQRRLLESRKRNLCSRCRKKAACEKCGRRIHGK